jgi:hypothetical protein
MNLDGVQACSFRELWDAFEYQPTTECVSEPDQAGALAKALTDDNEGCSILEQVRPRV